MGNFSPFFFIFFLIQPEQRGEIKKEEITPYTNECSLKLQYNAGAVREFRGYFFESQII